MASLAAQKELRERTDETVEQRDRLVKHFADFGGPESQANHIWFAADSIAKLGSPQDVAAQLADNDVLVRAFPEGVRVTVTTAEETEILLKAWDAAFAAEE